MRFRGAAVVRGLVAAARPAASSASRPHGAMPAGESIASDGARQKPSVIDRPFCAAPAGSRPTTCAPSATARALMQMGYGPEDWAGKPVIAIVNTWST
jgi:hypothetical protein